MTRRSVLGLMAAAIAFAPASPLTAHPGHTHKVLGTVTMAAADHVMLKDRDGKDVTVHITKDTKVLRDRKPARIDEIKSGMRVVVSAVTEKEKDVEKLIARTIELGTPPASK